MELMRSERGKSLIIVNGFKFRFHKNLRGDVQRWTCCVSTCKCYLKLKEGNILIAESFQLHNHEKPDERTISRQKINNKLKRKMEKVEFSKAMDIVQCELSRKKEESKVLTDTDVKLLSRNVYNARKKIRTKRAKIQVRRESESSSDPVYDDSISITPDQEWENERAVAEEVIIEAEGNVGAPEVEPYEEHPIFGEFISRIIKKQNEKSKTEKIKLKEVVIVVDN